MGARTMNLVDIFWFLIRHMELLLIVLLPVAIVAGVGWLIINQVGNSKIQTVAGPEAERIAEFGIEILGADWLKAHDFVWEGAYRSAIPNVETTFASWKQRDGHTYVSVYQTETPNLTTKTLIDITSTFGKGYSLTTAGTQDGPMLPICPGIYKQHFSTLDIEKLWLLHLEAEAVVAPTDLSQIDPLDSEDPIKLMNEECRRQIDYIKTLWFWPFRVPWWFFVNRPRHLNKTVVDRMGWRERMRLRIE